MPSSAKSFGKVYVPAEGKPGEFDLLESTRFSNQDLQWYNETGSLLQDEGPVKNYYGGHRCSLGFTIRNKNKLGQLEEFRGRFHLPLKVGEVSSPDVDYLDQLKQVELDYARELKLIPEDVDSGAKIMKASITASLFLFMSLGRKYLRESPFLVYLSLLIIFDEVADNHTTDISKLMHNLPYRRLMRMVGSGVEVYKTGDKSNGLANIQRLEEAGTKEEDSSPSPKGKMSEMSRRMYSGWIKLNHVIYDEALKHVGGNRSEAQPFFDALLELIESLTFQQSSEWKYFASKSTFEVSHEALRKVSIGTIAAAEGIALQQGIKLRPEIRSSFLFKWFLEQVGTHGGKANDFISYNKELTEDEDCHNQVYILHWIHGWPLEKALRKVLDEANQSLVTLNQVGELLLQAYQNDEDLADYIKLVKEVLSGHFLWMVHLNRYHKPLVYDCYVEEDGTGSFKVPEKIQSTNHIHSDGLLNPIM